MLVDIPRRGHRLHVLVQRHRGQLFAGQRGPCGLGSRQSPCRRQDQDEFRQRRQHPAQGLEGHLECGSKRQRHPHVETRPASSISRDTTGVSARINPQRAAGDVSVAADRRSTPAALGRGLAGIYLVSGDEPLLVGEAADAIRAAARAAGYADRTVFFIDRSLRLGCVRHAAASRFRCLPSGVFSSCVCLAASPTRVRPRSSTLRRVRPPTCCAW